LRKAFLFALADFFFQFLQVLDIASPPQNLRKAERVSLIFEMERA
jgi:hypothetical protein